jgi:pyruvate ferredoxin oxidoreductase beta subunit
MKMAETKKMKLKDYALKETYYGSGHRLCAGCNAGTVARQVSMAFNKPTYIVNATGCLEVASTIYPFTAWKIPFIHNAFENAGATASGLDAAFKAMYRKGNEKYKEYDIVAFGGDGGTFDIGLQSLSGALERGHDFLYILYDNGAYMNTGIQRSGGTPFAAATTTSPAGKVVPGKTQHKKPIADIVVAHRIPFVATASPAYPKDLIDKVRQGLDVEGPAFMHIDSTCTRGHRFDPALSIEMTRLAVETCIHPIYTVVNGEYTMDAQSKKYVKNPDKKKPVSDYINVQGRFRHIKDRKELIDEFQREVDKRFEELVSKCTNL